MAAEVADVIERFEDRFDQTSYRHESEEENPLCGTPGCIAGWTKWILEGRRVRDGEPVVAEPTYYIHAASEAGEALGLNPDEQQDMFRADPYGVMGENWRLSWDETRATAGEAVATLRTYAETGTVAWPMR